MLGAVLMYGAVGAQAAAADLGMMIGLVPDLRPGVQTWVQTGEVSSLFKSLKSSMGVSKYVIPLRHHASTLAKY